MRRSTRRREQDQQGWAAPPLGPFAPVRIQAQTAEELMRADVSDRRVA